MLRLLVVEGNARTARETYRAAFGLAPHESYAAALTELASDAVCDFCFPADPDARLPGGAGLSDYDGVFLTGSALNVYDGGPAIERQIAFARAVFASGTPMFGSCWGLQVASVAAGGVVVKNPRGREIGVARDIRLSPAGRGHPLLAGRPETFDALCSHLDHVAVPPPSGAVLAGNAMSEVQAMEIHFDGGLFWGVQYHPEFSFAEIASIVARQADALAREGLFASRGAAEAYASELAALEHGNRDDLLGELRIEGEVVDPLRRRIELVNFLAEQARPRRQGRR